MKLPQKISKTLDRDDLEPKFRSFLEQMQGVVDGYTIVLDKLFF